MPTAMPPAPLASKIGEARRQHHRLALVAVVVRLEIDGVAVDIGEQRHCGLGEPRFRVAHGRRRIAVDRAEIALPVDQLQAHGEILRHADQRVVDRLVAVRVIFTHHVADDARRLHVFLVGRMPLLVHRIEDAPMHRLQAVARIRQRPRHDHAHGVIEIRALHLLRDRHGANIRRQRASGCGVYRRQTRMVFRENPVRLLNSRFIRARPILSHVWLRYFLNDIQILIDTLFGRSWTPPRHCLF